MDHKVNQLLEEIDLARCRAHWSILVDLSKKYKKHNPEDTGFYTNKMCPSFYAKRCVSSF